MYDAKKIIAGVVIFLILVTIPAWYTVAAGGDTAAPEPQIVTEEDQCIESAEYMKDNHMKLLDDWRWSVVREGDRTYTSSEGKQWKISLRDSCMECHPNKADFCDRCHNYASVTPDCWDCHVSPDVVPVSPDGVSQ